MKKLLTSLIGFLILFVVFYSMGIEKIFSTLVEVKILYFLLAIPTFFIIELLATMKLKIVSKLKFNELLKSHLGGMLLGQITPGRTGYYYTSYSMARKEGKNLSGKIGIITLVQGTMMLVKIFMIIIAIIYFSFIFEIPEYIFLSFFMPVSIVSVIFFILYSKKSNKILSKIPMVNRGIKYLEMMQKSVKEVSFKKFSYMVILDLISWILWGIKFFLLSYSLGMHLSFLTCMMLQPILSAILFIPISPNALGLAESGSALMFNLLGMPATSGVAFLILFRLNSIIVDSIGITDFRNIKIPKKILRKI